MWSNKNKIIAILLVSLIASVFLNIIQLTNVRTEYKERVVTETKTIYRTDTIPQLKDTTIIKYQQTYLKVVDTLNTVIHDSVRVEVPIVQKVYSDDSTYTAYVSGYLPKLDSISIATKYKTVTIEKEKIKTKRLGIGLQGGYGYTPKGFQPYIGIGLNVCL